MGWGGGGAYLTGLAGNITNTHHDQQADGTTGQDYGDLSNSQYWLGLRL